MTGLLISETGVSAPALVLGVTAFGITATMFLLFLTIEGDWLNWSQATCLETGGCFCEKDRGTLVRQPANTFSNLAFSVVGVVVLMEAIQQQIYAGRRQASTSERLGTAFSCLYAISQVLLGAGSGWYHASLTFHGQWIDNAAMYLTVTAPILLTVSQLRLHHNPKITNIVSRYVLQWVFVNAFFGWLVLAVPSTRRYVFLVLIVALFIVEIYARNVLPKRASVAKLSVFGCALLSFAVAFFIWTLDIRKILCVPESLIQGHAFWHFGTGLAAFFVYLYYHPLCYAPTLPSSKKDLK